VDLIQKKRYLRRSLIFLISNFLRFLGRLFFLDLWRSPAARPVLFYAVTIILMGMFLFHWLEKWSYLDSLYFVVITLTTIGFGDYTPSTFLSKLLTIFFGINGIVLLLVLFDLIRQVRKSAFIIRAQKLAEGSFPPLQRFGNVATDSLEASPAVERPLLPQKNQHPSIRHLIRASMTKLFLIDLLQDGPSRWVLTYASFMIFIGGFVFHRVEKWSFLDSVYFMVITMTTIGYGDLTPAKDMGKLLTIFFGLNGIVVLLSLYDRIRAVRRQEPVGS